MSSRRAAGGVPEEIRVHHVAFLQFIKNEPPSRHQMTASLRKLSKLTLQHLTELSTDIYDELLRRQAGPNRAGHLPELEHIHPKRNIARTQLANISTARFANMCNDLIVEQRKRYPELMRIKPEADIHEKPVVSSSVVPEKAHMTEDDSDDSDVEYENYDPRTPTDADQHLRVSAASNYSWHNKPSVTGAAFSEDILKELNYESQQPQLDSATRVSSASQLNLDRRPSDLADYQRTDAMRANGSHETDLQQKSLYAQDNLDLGHAESDLEEALGVDSATNSSTSLARKMDKARQGADERATTLEHNHSGQSATMSTEAHHVHDAAASIADRERSAINGRTTHSRSSSNRSAKPSHSGAALARAESVHSNHSIRSSNSVHSTASSYSHKSVASRKASHASQTDKLPIPSGMLAHTQPVARPTPAKLEEIAEFSQEELRQRYIQLQEELERQHHVTEQVRHEALLFLEEMRLMTEFHRNEEDDSPVITKLRKQVAKLRTEVHEWRSKYAEAIQEIRTLRHEHKASSGIDATIALREAKQFYDPAGKVREAAVKRFHRAIDELLVVARTKPDRQLDKLHDVVLATRVITKEIGDTDTNYTQNSRLVQRTANQLISVIRNLTVSQGVLPLSLLDAACSDLAFAVAELLKAARICPDSSSSLDSSPARSEKPDSDTHTETAITPLRGLGSPNINSYSGHRNGFDKWQAGHTKSVPSSSNGSTEIKQATEAEPTILNTQEQTEKKDRLSVVHDSPTHSTRSRSSYDEASSTSIQASPAKMSEKPSAAAVKADRFTAVQEFKPDSTIAEIQMFLEDQTSEAVEAIQDLLVGIRTKVVSGELLPKAQRVVALVDKMIDTAKPSLENTRNEVLKTKGLYILQGLSDCANRLNQLCEELSKVLVSNAPDRQLKQRLAGVAFDMAKSTKELVKTVEEVSLREELAQIDSQLAH